MKTSRFNPKEWTAKLYLFLVFPKIMRVLLLATTMTLAILPILSKQAHYASFLENYSGQVKSIPLKLDNEGTIWLNLD